MSALQQFIGELLVRDNIISREHLARCLLLQQDSKEFYGKKIGEILVANGYMESYKLIKYLVIQGVYEKGVLAS